MGKPETELLPDNEKSDYHTMKAQGLCLSKRGRLDLQMSFAFHCTRVRNPDRDDQHKLARTFRYINDTRYLPLILSINEF